ncbi:hypothetical protein KR032_009115 [Drosophila birchii]|nr:hypothetical protein KR032_009115 [Drosophila birchii]
MNNSKLPSPEDSVLSVEDMNSPSSPEGFLKFLKEFQMVSDDKLTYEEILERAKCRWSELSPEKRMQFIPANLRENVSLSSVIGDRLLEGPAPVDTAISDTAFNNFMESFTIKLSQKAAKKWESMTPRERAAYAAKDDIGSSNSTSSCAMDGENGREPLSSRLIKEMFGNIDKECAKPKPKCAKPKPKCAKPKPKCAKPKPKCAKPKPKCAKPKPKCAKPKPKCPKPKPRCPKPKPTCT